MEETVRGPVRRNNGGLVLRLRLQPRSSRKGVIDLRGGRVRFAVHAPPAEGAANRELIKALARILSVSPSSLSIVSGERSREKDVLVESGMSESDLLDRLGLPPGE